MKDFNFFHILFHALYYGRNQDNLFCFLLKWLFMHIFWDTDFLQIKIKMIIIAELHKFEPKY